MVQVRSEPPAFGPPKTSASVRSVPLPDVVANALASHIHDFGCGEDGLLFPNTTGAPLRRNRFYDGVWRPARIAVGLPDGTKFHALRHTYASLLIAANESPKVIQVRLGHSSITETMDTYGHLYPNSEESTRTVIDAALAGVEAHHADVLLTRAGEGSALSGVSAGQMAVGG